MPGKIDKKSFHDVCGNVQEVVIYGLDTCRYYKVENALEKAGIVTLNYNTLGYQKRSVNDIKSTCKLMINRIILENFKRKYNGDDKPILPLLFCVEYEHLKTSELVNLDIFKVATSSSLSNFKNIADSELRRGYKLFKSDVEITGVDPRIKTVVEETFKFAKVIESPEGDFKLQAVAPFWQHSEWEQHWSKRVRKTTNQAWRNEFKESVNAISFKFKKI